MLVGNAEHWGSGRVVSSGVRRCNSGHPRAGRAVPWFGWKWRDFLLFLQACSLAASSHHNLPHFHSIAALPYQYRLFLYPNLILFCSEKTGSLNGDLDAFHFPSALFFRGLWFFVIVFKKIIPVSEHILVTQRACLPMEEVFHTKGANMQFGHAALIPSIRNTGIYSVHLSATCLMPF